MTVWCSMKYLEFGVKYLSECIFADHTVDVQYLCLYLISVIRLGSVSESRFDPACQNICFIRKTWRISAGFDSR